MRPQFQHASTTALLGPTAGTTSARGSDDTPPGGIRKTVRVRLSYWRFSERNFRSALCKFLSCQKSGEQPHHGVFGMRARNLLLVIAAGLASAAFAYLGTGLHPIWWLLWLAPIPVLAIAPRLHGSAALLLGTIVWLICEMNQWKYVTHAIELPTHITILYFVVPAVVFGFGVLFVRSFIRRGSLFLASVAFPTYWVAYEYLTATASPHSTWGNLAYTQMNCLPVIQLAAITGIWGISFIVFLFAGAAAALLSGAGEPWQRRALAIAVGAALCAVFVFGKRRVQSNPSAQPVAVTLVAKDVPMSIYLGSEEQALELLREYADEVHRITPAGTQAVVLPEKIGRVSERALAEVDTLFSSAAI